MSQARKRLRVQGPQAPAWGRGRVAPVIAPCHRHELRDAYLLSEVGSHLESPFFYPKGEAEGGIKFHLFKITCHSTAGMLASDANKGGNKGGWTEIHSRQGFDRAVLKFRAQVSLRRKRIQKKGGLTVTGWFVCEQLLQFCSHVLGSDPLRRGGRLCHRSDRCLLHGYT